MKRTFNTCIFLLLCMFSSNLSATYYIAGNGNDDPNGKWCDGNNWSVNATVLVNDEISFTALPAEWYVFKITDGSWGSGHEWGYTDVDASLSSPMYKDGGGNNIGFRLQAPTDVTIKMVNNKVVILFDREYCITGNGAEAGDGAWLAGHNWWAYNADATLDANYSRTYYNLPVGSYQFKVKENVDAAWNDDCTWGYDHLDTENSNAGEDWSGNIGFNLSLPSDVKISLVNNMIRLNISPVYFIAGNGSSTERGTWCNQKPWWQDEPNSRLDAATLSKTYTALPAGEYEFKITNGRWQDGGGTVWAASDVDAETSSKGYMGSGDNNIEFHLQSPTDVTISFNPETNKISLVSSNGYFLSNVYSVVGVTSLTGSDWDNMDTSTELTPKGDGTYELVMRDKVLDAGNYAYKIIGGHRWGTGCEYPTTNATLSIPEAGTYTVVFTLNPAEGTQSAAAYLQHNLTISAYGYSTFYSDKAYSLPDGLTATIFTNVCGQMLTGESIATIPANTGVVLQGEAGATYTLLQTTTGDTYPANLLHGTTDDAVINNSNVHYILGVNSGQCGLFWPNGTAEGVGSFTNAAGKAYLELAPTAAPARVRGFVLSNTDTATAVEQTSTDEEGVYYDLLGRKVAQPQPGNIYIRNGQKIVLF